MVSASDSRLKGPIDQGQESWSLLSRAPLVGPEVGPSWMIGCPGGPLIALVEAEGRFQGVGQFGSCGPVSAMSHPQEWWRKAVATVRKSPLSLASLALHALGVGPVELAGPAVVAPCRNL